MYTYNTGHPDCEGQLTPRLDVTLTLTHDAYFKREFEVIFKDGDTILETQYVDYGQAATAPTVEIRDGYDFVGWDVDFSNVKGNLTVKAIYKKSTVTKFKVTFVDSNGEVINTQSIQEGQAATAPNVTPKRGYTFKGWDKPFDKVTSHLTVRALYSRYLLEGKANKYVDRSKTPLSRVMIRVFTSDWKLVGGMLTGDDGKFSIDIKPEFESSFYYVQANGGINDVNNLLLNKDETAFDSKYRNVSASTIEDPEFTFVHTPIIGGTVVDSVSRAKIAGARVSTWYSTLTDDNGRFTMYANDNIVENQQEVKIVAWSKDYYITNKTVSISVHIDSLKNGDVINIGEIELQKHPASGVFSDASKNYLMLIPNTVTSSEVSNATLNFYSNQDSTIEIADILLASDTGSKILIDYYSQVRIYANDVLQSQNEYTISKSSDGIHITMKVLPKTQYKITYGIQAPASDTQATEYGTSATLNGTLIGKQNVIINNLTVEAPSEVSIGDIFDIHGEVTAEQNVSVMLNIFSPEGNNVYSKTTKSSGFFYKFKSIKLATPITSGEYDIEVTAIRDGQTIATGYAKSFISNTAIDLKTITLRDKQNSASINATPGSFVSFIGWADGELRAYDERELKAAVTLKDFSNYESANFVMHTPQGVFSWSAERKNNEISAYLKSFIGTGKATVSIEITKKDGSVVSFVIANIIILIDPSGYVYDKDTKKRIEGATATLYYKNESGEWIFWNAEDYMQINPQQTDDKGAYGWMVPVGEYEVRVTAPNYKDYSTLDTFGIINILPERKDVNIGMISLKTTDTNNQTSSSEKSENKRSEISTDTVWVNAQQVMLFVKNAKKNGLNYIRTKSKYLVGIRKEELQSLVGYRYLHDTLENNAVQVRVSINDTSKSTKDLLVSGYTKGNSIDRVGSKFRRWFTNGARVIHFDQQGSWGQKVIVAAKLDFTGMDTSNLCFYSFDSSSNKYKRINIGKYRIDERGYLHFKTDVAGDIIVSDGKLHKK